MKIKQQIINLAAVFSLLLLPMLAVSAPAYAANEDAIQNGVCDGANNLQVNPEDSAADACKKGDATSTDGVNRTIRNIINIFSTIVGVIAVIMIVWGGLRYITSGGDSGKIGNAKNTIIYALLGLIIVALAQFIVKFVLTRTVNSVS